MNRSSRDTLSIGDLAARYGVCTETLRIWERQGLIPAAKRTAGGHRRYHRGHIEALDRLFTAAEATNQVGDR